MRVARHGVRSSQERQLEYDPHPRNFRQHPQFVAAHFLLPDGGDDGGFPSGVEPAPPMAEVAFARCMATKRLARLPNADSTRHCKTEILWP